MASRARRTAAHPPAGARAEPVTPVPVKPAPVAVPRRRKLGTIGDAEWDNMIALMVEEALGEYDPGRRAFVDELYLRTRALRADAPGKPSKVYPLEDMISAACDGKDARMRVLAAVAIAGLVVEVSREPLIVTPVLKAALKCVSSKDIGPQLHLVLIEAMAAANVEVLPEQFAGAIEWVCARAGDTLDTTMQLRTADDTVGLLNLAHNAGLGVLRSRRELPIHVALSRQVFGQKISPLVFAGIVRWLAATFKPKGARQ